MKSILIYFFLVMLVFAACRNDKSEEIINNSPTNAIPTDTVTTFEKKYGSFDGDEYATSIGTNGNDVYILGSTNAKHNSSYEMLLMKFNSIGDSIWSKTYGGTENTTGERLFILNDGLLLCGTRVRDGASDKEFYLVKTDFNGTVQWTRSTGTALDDVMLGGCKANTDGFLLCGFTNASANGLNAFMVRINNNGDTLWTRSYGTAFNDGAADAVATNDGFIVYGFTDTANNANRNFYLLHLNEQGDILNTRVIGGNDYEEAQAIVKLNNGNFLYCGHSASIDPMHNLVAQEIDAQLNTIHAYEFGGMMHDGGEAVAQDENGNYVFVARSSSYGSGDEDVELFTSNANGVIQKQQRFGNTENQEAYQILVFDHSLIMAGATRVSGTANRDFYVVRCNQ